jgi:transcription elongation factor GreA
MSAKEVLLTYEGLKKLEEELDYLKGEKRKENAERIKAALAFGDISENSEYDDAKNEQAQNETRIMQLESMLKHASVIDDDDVDTRAVSIGTHVRIRETKTKDETDYHIVGSTEADPASYKISNESPVGSALLGHKTGDTVEIEVPGGKIKYKIIDIHK